ncbi:choice-of-anchor A family protein [Flavobacterium sp. D11R37]|uniref:collagen-binding domain-containing protein n=1 Tax=Flavobacterium coralii TaxID=2838017 RepID=UPI001CA738A2|nr:collagen-binding domain-containing protein [Flavobacterium coralii]MBY8962998.1 choice-of-anchor A family protein [Flavobacterium coralii]
MTPKITLSALLLLGLKVFSQSPTAPAQGFNVFTEQNLTLITNESEGPVACGGNLSIQGNYQISVNDAGTFTVNNVKIGLLVGGKVNYTSGNAVQINNNAYVKIGNNTGSHVWYYDQNNAASPIRVTPTPDYNSSPRIMLQANANQLNVGVNNNPVFQSGVIDFAGAFQSLKASSLSIAQCTHNAQLTNPNGQSISNTNLPNQIKINMQDGINYFNITGTDLNNVQQFTYNNQPSASKILVINVDAPGTFNWKVWNQAGVGFQNCPYILYNFYNTTQLNITGNSTIEGTVFAPFADVNKTVNQSNIEGQVIAKSLVHGGGEMHYALFAPTISGCAPVAGVAPTAGFNVNQTAQCFNGNQFTFSNTSNTGTAVQPEAPVTYAWDFGDGTTSTDMNPVKQYAAGGTYTVTLTATNTYGSDTYSQVVTVNTVAAAVFTQSVTSTGAGSITKQVTLSNAGSYNSITWYLNNDEAAQFANQSSASFTFTQAGYNTVSVLVTDANGCSATYTTAVVIESEDVNTGNDGGLESESLGDAVSKRYVQRKMKSVPTALTKTDAMLFNKGSIQHSYSARSAQGQTMLDMFPSQLAPGNVAHVTSPTDILDYTVAQEVLSVDFMLSGKTKAVVLGVRTEDKVYNHTKASCDRLRGAEIMDVKTVTIDGYNFLMQAIKQRNGVTEYAISFAAGKNNNDNFYALQTNWFVKEYTAYNDVYNFQVWSVNPENTVKLVKDIINNLNSYLPVHQTEVQKMPETYAAKVSREGVNLMLKLKSTKENQSIEVAMDEVYSETNGFALRYNPFNSQKEQTVQLEVKDGYEYDGLIKVNGAIQDAFYHADGNWGLDYDAAYTTINSYLVYNDFERVYNEEELAIHRNVQLKAHSEYDYLTLYKSLLPGNLPADYTEYGYLSFKAKGSGLLELGLVKASVEEWKHQYRAIINVGEEEQTYYVPFDFFTSTKTNQKITADDLSMLTFTFLPVKAGTTDLDLTIEDVKFTKSAPQGYEELLNTMQNEFMVYPNPSRGTVNCLLYSDIADSATVTLHDITGKVIYTAPVNLEEGRNELQFNFDVPTGLMFFNITGTKTNYGTSKIMFQ